MKSFFKKLPGRRLLPSLFFIGLGITLLLCLPLGNEQADFQHFTSRQFVHEVTSNTLNLHYTIKNPSKAGIKNYEICLGDFSKDCRRDNTTRLKELKDLLNEYSYRSLSEDDRLTYDILHDYLSRQLRLADFPLYEEVLTPSGGVTSQLPILLAEYKFYSKQDVEDYLALLSQIDEYYADLLAFEQEKSEAGLFMSDASCEKVIGGCEVFLNHPTDNFLFSTFDTRLEQVEDLDALAIDSYKKEHARIMEAHVIPAYRNIAAGLTKLMGTGRNDWGLCHYPSGKEYYSALAASYTGCDETMDELAEEIKEKRAADLAICTDILSKEPDLLTKAEAMDVHFDSNEAMIEQLQRKLLKDFPSPPDSDWKISYVDPCLKDYLAPAFYITAPIDAYLDNCIYINDAADYDSIHLFTTLAHESFPGHLYQTMLSYSYGMNPLHTLLNYPGYTEGWATYVEMISYQYLDLEENLANLLQYNQSAMLSLYASSDIGIHYYGWQTEEMLDFWKDYGITDPATIRAITDLILEEPGNYLKYYVGYMKFCQLREECMEKQKERFDPIAFHKEILEIGPAPFALLKEKICDD